MKKVAFLLALTSIAPMATAATPGDAAQLDTLQKAMKEIRAKAPVLREGEFVQDEHGCVYNVVHKAGFLQLEPSVKTPDGKPVCKVGPTA
ncbi:hypothetical protein [Ralstonia insidiosa]|jgi:hypothetical protein|nr:hypothetical protein [Ralstonia insidiosa]MBA9939909.1 hypothetical protein [Ralstonia insidiosa]MBC9968570.1 hypothetical protein [Ralstonia insidiosa]MBX3904609.1 hypothetical protein [Ralstonia insidiosa]